MKTDGRRKLTDKQIAEIQATPLKPGRFNGASELAKKYGVSKRTIQFLFNPEKLVKNRELAKERKKVINNLVD